MEKKLAASLEAADQGIYHIGVALQVIDDITDFYDDTRDRRHNYLVSPSLNRIAFFPRERMAYKDR